MSIQDEYSIEGIALMHGLPPSLAKALVDVFDFACGLTTGEVIRFETAEWNSGSPYVTLFGPHSANSERPLRKSQHTSSTNSIYESNNKLTFPFCRGLDVRIDQIVWCADAPEGS